MKRMFVIVAVGYGQTETPQVRPMGSEAGAEINVKVYTMGRVCIGGAPSLVDKSLFEVDPSDNVQWDQVHTTVLTLPLVEEISTSPQVTIKARTNVQNFLLPVSMTVAGKEIPLIKDVYPYLSVRGDLEEKSWLRPLYPSEIT